MVGGRGGEGKGRGVEEKSVSIVVVVRELYHQFERALTRKDCAWCQKIKEFQLSVQLLNTRSLVGWTDACIVSQITLFGEKLKKF